MRFAGMRSVGDNFCKLMKMQSWELMLSRLAPFLCKFRPLSLGIREKWTFATYVL